MIHPVWEVVGSICSNHIIFTFTWANMVLCLDSVLTLSRRAVCDSRPTHAHAHAIGAQTGSRPPPNQASNYFIFGNHRRQRRWLQQKSMHVRARTQNTHTHKVLHVHIYISTICIHTLKHTHMHTPTKPPVRAAHNKHRSPKERKAQSIADGP